MPLGDRQRAGAVAGRRGPRRRPMTSRPPWPFSTAVPPVSSASRRAIWSRASSRPDGSLPESRAAVIASLVAARSAARVLAWRRGRRAATCAGRPPRSRRCDAGRRSRRRGPASVATTWVRAASEPGLLARSCQRLRTSASAPEIAVPGRLAEGGLHAGQRGRAGCRGRTGCRAHGGRARRAAGRRAGRPSRPAPLRRGPRTGSTSRAGRGRRRPRPTTRRRA